MLRFPTPVLRSKPFKALPVSRPTAGPPNALKSFEQAQRVLAASSANTPKIECEPDARGWMNTVFSAVCGLMRTIPPSPKRPTRSAPSEVDVMLSGNAFVPGTEIDSTVWVAGADRPTPCATESKTGTLNQNFRYEAGRNLIRCHPF